MGRLKKDRDWNCAAIYTTAWAGPMFSSVQAAALTFQPDFNVWCHHHLEVDIEVLLYIHRNQRLIRDRSPGWPPRLSHSSRALITSLEMCHLSVILQDHSSVFQTRCAQPYFKIQHVLFCHFTFIFLESLCDICEQSFYGSIPRACNYFQWYPWVVSALGCNMCTLHSHMALAGWFVYMHKHTHTYTHTHTHTTKQQGYKWRSRIKCDSKYITVLHTHTHMRTVTSKHIMCISKTQHSLSKQVFSAFKISHVSYMLHTSKSRLATVCTMFSWY